MSAPLSILQKYIQPGLVLLNRYQIQKPIGSGAYGSIFLANDLTMHDQVAVKALPPAAETSSGTAQDRFRREMNVISSLVHPNIISIYDFGQTPEGVPFMVLEYAQGRTLEQHVLNNPMSLEDGLRVVRQIASALHTAHQAGIVHRDLKPANIMIHIERHGPHVKVLDFGMAKLLSEPGAAPLPQLTMEGMAVGTPRYIAPEQARGKNVGPWSDLYALGLLCYEIFTGQRAVKAKSIEEAVAAHVSREPLHLPELHMVPEPVLSLLDKLLKKNIKHRYQRAQDVVHDVDALLRPSAKKAPSNTQADETVQLAQIQGLDIDHEAFAQRQAVASAAPVPQRRAYTPAQDTRPTTVMDVVDMALVLVLAGVLYTLWTAQFFVTQGFGARLVFGFIPLIVIALIALPLARRFHTTPVARLFWLGELVAIVLAHIPPRSLFSELILHPAWFLKPLEDVPVLSLFYDFVAYASSSYGKWMWSVFF